MNTPRLLLLVCLVLGCFTAPGLALEKAVRIARIGEVIDRWTPDQHLYVKGDVGVDDRRLSELEQWLDQHGPHWTVVLMQSAGDQRYQAPDGRTYTGMDAVEYALGYGLANRSAFGKWEHPRTGETDGAVFVLFLTERKFSYYGSEAQDRRNLGESRWVGDLDQPAFRAMRGGGRILDAVKDTVSTINSRLARSINAEQAAEARAQRERERALAELRVNLQRAREAAQAAKQQSETLAAALPAATGALRRPPVDEWNRTLTEIDQEVSGDNVRDRSQQLSQVMGQINRYLNWYAQHDSFSPRRAELSAEAEALRTQMGGFAAAQAAEAGKQLQAAADTHANGDPAFIDQLRSAEQSLDAGRQAIEAEQQRRARAVARRRLIWNTAIATLALTVVALLTFLYWLNRRRVPARQQALKAFFERRKTVRREMDRVLKLFDRSREILGSKEKLDLRGYGGRTKELTSAALRKIDDLLIMSGEVDRVMDEAEELIRPSNIVAKLQNQFSATRYERGINRISGEPLKFHENQGIPAIVRIGQTDADARPPEEVSLTFEQVFSAFRQRSEEVTRALDVVESSLLQVNDGLHRLEQQLDQATAVDNELATAAEEDGFFHVPNFFETLLPSAETDHDVADRMAASDPVAAVEQYIPQGLRKLEDALRVAGAIQRARTETFPRFDEHAPRLKDRGYDTDWIQAAVGELTRQADELFALATERAVTAEAAQLDEAVRALGDRVQQSADLAEQLEQTAASEIDSLRAHIDSARQRIATQLGVSVEACLHEDQANPDARLKAAHQQLAAAKAALQLGNVDAARAASDALHNEVATARQIVDYSLEVLGKFESTVDEIRHRHRTVQSQLPGVQDLVQRASAAYAESALRLQASDPAYPDPEATLGSQMHDSQVDLNASWELLDHSERAYRGAKLLEADGRAQVARGHIERSEARFDDLREHVASLESKSQENSAALAGLNQRTRQLEGELQDPRTTTTTLAAYSELQQSIQLASQEIVGSPSGRDPFQAAEQLARLTHQLTKIEGFIGADREAHAEASRAVQGAVHQLATALEYVDKARRDGIPDSKLTIRSVHEIKQLEEQLGRVRTHLQSRHDDWRQVDEDAARINAELGAEAARLKGELERAQQSVDALQAASRDVFEATRWTGPYGVRVEGAPGADELERARRALNGGNYELMMQLSRAAAMAAQLAVQQAEREVQRQQREEARRAEAARRKEMERRRRSRPIVIVGPPRGGGFGSGWGGFGGGGGGGFGGFGGGGGGGGGSGFGRSGW